MLDIIKTIEALPDMMRLKSASDADIQNAENELGLKFAEEYKAYLAHFGAILADGIELSGIAKSKTRHVVSLTQQEREIKKDVPQNLYVVENTGIEGLVTWQDENGSIYRTVPNTGVTKIAYSLEEYIQGKRQ